MKTAIRQMREKRIVPNWLTLREAAQRLALTPDALRRQLERRAKRAPDGGTESIIDGVRGRKFGTQWRVTFGARWTE